MLAQLAHGFLTTVQCDGWFELFSIIIAIHGDREFGCGLAKGDCKSNDTSGNMVGTGGYGHWLSISRKRWGSTNDYIAPIILAIGILGNLASFSVMTSRDMRTKSISVYLAALAVFDTMSLHSSFYKHWYSLFASIAVTHKPDYMCKLELTLWLSPFVVNAYVIIAVSVERFIVTWFPYRSKVLCTLNCARVITVRTYNDTGHRLQRFDNAAVWRRSRGVRPWALLLLLPRS